MQLKNSRNKLPCKKTKILKIISVNVAGVNEKKERNFNKERGKFINVAKWPVSLQPTGNT